MFHTAFFIGSIGARAPVVGDGGLPAVASPFVGVDADAAATLLATPTAGSPQASVGGTVGRILDAFGSGRTFDQASSAIQAILIAGAMNGRNGLRFFPGYHYAMPGSLVAQPLQGSWTMAAAYWPNWFGQDFAYLFAAGAGSVPTLMERLGLYMAPNPGADRNTSAEFASVAIGDPPYAFQNQVLHRVVARYSVENGLRLRLRIGADNTEFEAQAPAGVQADTLPWDTVLLGAAPDGAGGVSAQFDGEIYELRVWASEASDAQVDALMSYLTAKWGTG